MKLAKFFVSLRTDRDLTLRDIAKKSKPKIDHTTLWKIENGKPVRASTLGNALRAIGLSEKDDAYVEAFALWSTEQAGTLPVTTVDRSIEKVKRGNQRAFDKAIDRAAAALQAMPEEDWPLVLEALERPEALKLWIQSTQLARKAS